MSSYSDIRQKKTTYTAFFTIVFLLTIRITRIEKNNQDRGKNVLQKIGLFLER